MSGDGADRKRRLFGWIVKALCAGILALGLSQGLFAQGKGLYYEGYLWDCGPLQGGGLQVDQYAWDGSQLNIAWSDQFPATPSGSLGMCVFNGLIYCFYTSSASGGTLGYVTVDPSAHQETGPTKIATGVGGGGVAAAVCDGALYLFTTEYMAFQSKDGKNFSSWSWTPAAAPQSMLGAVTFYPQGDGWGDRAAIMIVFNDSSWPAPVLGYCILTPSSKDTGGWCGELPWPPANPYLWSPVAAGNLVLGTSGGGLGTPGAKAPCVQFFGLTGKGQDGSHEGRWEYNIASATWSFTDWTVGADMDFLEVFPWFDTLDSKGTMRLQHIASLGNGQGSTIKVGASDIMVPQSNDPVYGWAGVPTPTSNSAGSELQNLWTLVGVVLGPPPFPMNGTSNACASSDDALAWVDYGKDTSTTVTTTSTSSSTISVASQSTLKGGLGELSLDLSYAHAWTSSHGTSHTVSVSQNFQFGPCSEQGNQGAYGWAIFNAPTLVTQWYKLYAYDYNLSTGHGTYLDQDIYATATGAVVQQTAYFELANPSQGEYPGLFAGMTLYPNSTDIAGWHLSIPSWDNGGSDWTAVFGDKTSPQMPVLNLGLRDEVSYTETDTTTGSKGNSNSFGVQAGAKLNIYGFSEAVTVGYDGEWTTNTENESTITKDVSCALNVPIPSNTPGYVNSMTVQPFWLQAETAKAPWIPSGCGGDLPWCITWDVTQFGTVGAGTMGLSGPPASASGTIRLGGEQEKDTYKVNAGRLAWLEADGSETPLPMTADQFDPSKGASVSLNGHVFSADGTKGKWVRHGGFWKYRTREGVNMDPFTLELDLANKTWSLDASSKTLEQEVKTAEGEVRVRLDLQGSYKFTTWLKHDVDTAWSHKEKKSAWQPYGAHEVEGAYNSHAGAGNLKLKGHIPKHAAQFGDLEIRINGVPVFIPLLSLDGFLQDLRRGRVVKYAAEGIAFEIDFGTGKWKASIEGSQFKSGMAPKKDEIRVHILLGGATLSDQTFTVHRHITTLRYPL